MPDLPPLSEDLSWPPGLIPFSPHDLSIQRDPYAHYAWMRGNAPVLRAAAGGAELWFVSRYDDVTAALKDPATFSSQVIDPALLPFLMVADPPEHSRLRQAVSRAFTTRAVSNLETFVRDRVAAHWQRFAADGGGDAFSGLTQPIALETIGHMIGLRPEEAYRLLDWAEDAQSYFGRIARRAPGTANDEAAMAHMLDHFRTALAGAAEAGDETIAGHIARLGQNGVLTDKEMTHLCVLLLLAGSETTALSMLSGMILLCRRPALLDRLSGTPAEIGKFVTELTRLHGPAHRVVRVATRDTMLGDVAIPQGAEMRFLVASANRDSRRFPEGDDFDMDRKAGGSIAFGLGIHACLGMHLARQELTAAFETIAASGKRLTLDETQSIRYVESASMGVSGRSKVRSTSRWSRIRCSPASPVYSATIAATRPISPTIPTRAARSATASAAA